jgi:hypothetical protein
VNRRLQRRLEGLLDELREGRVEADRDAERAREEGNLAGHYDLSLDMELPEALWALERWDEACARYRRNADMLSSLRELHLSRDPEYPVDELSHWEAATLIKAGRLGAGRKRLAEAVAYWSAEPHQELKLAELALHGAQAGMPELKPLVDGAAAARAELPGEGERDLLRYEPAEAALLLGDREGAREAVEAAAPAELVARERPGYLFPAPLDRALADAIGGLRELLALGPGGDSRPAVEAFEEAMLGFLEFGGLDWNVYFMRLDARLATDVEAGRQPDPNPCAK